VQNFSFDVEDYSFIYDIALSE